MTQTQSTPELSGIEWGDMTKLFTYGPSTNQRGLQYVIINWAWPFMQYRYDEQTDPNKLTACFEPLNKDCKRYLIQRHD